MLIADTSTGSEVSMDKMWIRSNKIINCDVKQNLSLETR